MSEGLIYLVDDQESIRASLSLLFESIGLEVKTFVAARDFLSDYSPDRHPSCLLMDLRMPGMSGLALQKELKQRGARIPIIFMSGHGDVSSCARALKNGALEFLEKPLNEQKLLDALNFALNLDQKSTEHHTRPRAFPDKDQRDKAQREEEDESLRKALLWMLYLYRRENVDRPGLGDLDLERDLGCSAGELEFHLWYLKEKGWVERTDTGGYAITAAGVDSAPFHEVMKDDAVAQGEE